ncbi:hypothetical protein H1C71_042295, partial [Ictidomys tridecemlineatus]
GGAGPRLEILGARPGHTAPPPPRPATRQRQMGGAQAPGWGPPLLPVRLESVGPRPPAQVEARGWGRLSSVKLETRPEGTLQAPPGHPLRPSRSFPFRRARGLGCLEFRSPGEEAGVRPEKGARGSRGTGAQGRWLRASRGGRSVAAPDPASTRKMRSPRSLEPLWA